MTELNVKETIDILASRMRFQFSVYDMLAQLVYARVIAPCSKSKTVSSVFPHLYNSVPVSEDQVYDGCPLSGHLTKNTLNSLTTAMSSIIREISAASFLTAPIITLRSICQPKTSRKALPRRTGMIRSSDRLFFWMQTLSLWPCRCIRGTSQRSLISEGALTR